MDGVQSPPKFKEGDRVKHIKYHLKGTVEGLDKDPGAIHIGNHKYVVDWDLGQEREGREVQVNEEDLELLTD